jgi:uncharacterized membrane protein
MRAIVGWDVGAGILCAMAWTIILRADAKETARRAAAHDPGRTLVWVIAWASSLVSLFAAAVVLRRARGTGEEQLIVCTVLSLAAVALSWLLTHTSYALRYAHLYYRGARAGGLVFPGDKPPCDFDFAYFSFTLGMCFQVSDVSVNCTRVRRTVLGHSLLSFVYNTTILALALNLFFGFFG